MNKLITTGTAVLIGGMMLSGVAFSYTKSAAKTAATPVAVKTTASLVSAPAAKTMAAKKGPKHHHKSKKSAKAAPAAASK